MGSVILGNAQFGSNVTATNNFTLRNPDAGNLVLSVGNIGITSLDVVEVDNTGEMYVLGNVHAKNFIGNVNAGLATDKYDNSWGGTDALANVSGAFGGVDNTAIGYNALTNHTTGQGANAFGSKALYSNTTGAFNDAFGWEALYSNTTGTNNNAFGAGALYTNETGSYNTAFGDTALNSSVGNNF